jgi:hypothetical protein
MIGGEQQRFKTTLPAAVRWPDGTVHRAANWQELYWEWRLGHPTFQAGQINDIIFRNEIERRAAVWSGTELNLQDADYEHFFREMERAKMLRILPKRRRVIRFLRRQ